MLVPINDWMPREAVIVGHREEFHDPACQLLAHDTSPVCARETRAVRLLTIKP